MWEITDKEREDMTPKSFGRLKKPVKRQCVAYAVITPDMEAYAINPNRIGSYSMAHLVKKNLADKGIKAKVIRVQVLEM